MRKLIAAMALLWATPAVAFEQIEDAQTFGTRVVGAVYMDANGSWFRFNEDGTLSGAAGDRALTGNWNFQRGMACYNRALGGEALPSDCIVVLIDGTRLVTVRSQGQGKQTLYTRQ